MRSFYLRIWGFMLAAALALSPVALLAQSLAPESRAAILNAAAVGSGYVALSTVDAPMAIVVAPEVVEIEIDEPEVDEPEIDEPEVDEPEVDEPEVDEPEVEEPEVEEPEVEDVVEEVVDDAGVPIDAGDWVAHDSAGLTIRAPAEWDVTATDMFDNLFTMEVPGSEFVGLIQGGDSLDFPGVMAVIIMRSLPEFIVAQFGEGASLVGTDVFVSPQGLPVVKIEFEADIERMPFEGAFYVISPGATAYIMIALSPDGLWSDLRDVADGVAASIEFAPELITLEIAEDGPIYVVDLDETLEIVLPQGWQATTTGDPAMPLLAVSPGYEYVAALTASRENSEDVADLLDEVLADGEIDDAVIDLVMDLMFDAMALDQSMLNLDPSMSEVFVVRDELVLRLIGALTIDDGVQMDAGIYVGLRRDGISALIVFGDIDAALADEDVLIDLLDSLLFIR